MSKIFDRIGPQLNIKFSMVVGEGYSSAIFLGRAVRRSWFKTLLLQRRHRSTREKINQVIRFQFSLVVYEYMHTVHNQLKSLFEQANKSTRTHKLYIQKVQDLERNIFAATNSVSVSTLWRHASSFTKSSSPHCSETCRANRVTLLSHWNLEPQ